MLTCLMDIETEDLAVTVQIKFGCCGKTDIVIEGHGLLPCVLELVACFCWFLSWHSL
jgi:hypothetical protein